MPGQHPRPTNQPVRDSHENQSSIEAPQQVPDGQLLPRLDAELTVFQFADDRGIRTTQAVVLDHLLQASGRAYWADALGTVTTATMAKMAPSRRLLERIHAARGFTAPQHRAIVEEIATSVRGAGPDHTSDPAPALLVAPHLDAPYRDSDHFTASQGATLVGRNLASLRRASGAADVPVLATTKAEDRFAQPILDAADRVLTVESTDVGPRFEGDEFSTTLFPVGDGQYQTTLEYWADILASRIEATDTTTTQSIQSGAVTMSSQQGGW